MVNQARPTSENTGKKKWLVKSLVAILLLFVPPGLAYLFSKFILIWYSEKTLTQLLLEPMFYTFLALIPGAYLAWRWSQHINPPKKFVEEEVMPALKWAAVSILLVCAPLGLVFLYSKFLADASSDDPATAFTNALGRLPTQTMFYVFIAGLVGFCLAWRWWQYVSLSKEFFESRNGDSGKHGLTPRDWWVALGLRKRALSLRTRADILLIGVFLFLFAGIYVIIFILPGIRATDPLRAKVAQTAAFFAEFGQTLQAMVDGQYWIKTSSIEIDTTAEYVITKDEVLIYTITGGGGNPGFDTDEQ